MVTHLIPRAMCPLKKTRPRTRSPTVLNLPHEMVERFERFYAMVPKLPYARLVEPLRGTVKGLQKTTFDPKLQTLRLRTGALRARAHAHSFAAPEEQCWLLAYARARFARAGSICVCLPPARTAPPGHTAPLQKKVLHKRHLNKNNRSGNSYACARARELKFFR